MNISPVYASGVFENKSLFDGDEGNGAIGFYRCAERQTRIAIQARGNINGEDGAAKLIYALNQPFVFITQCPDKPRSEYGVDNHIGFVGEFGNAGVDCLSAFHIQPFDFQTETGEYVEIDFGVAPDFVDVAANHDCYGKARVEEVPCDDEAVAAIVAGSAENADLRAF